MYVTCPVTGRVLEKQLAIEAKIVEKLSLQENAEHLEWLRKFVPIWLAGPDYLVYNYHPFCDAMRLCNLDVECPDMGCPCVGHTPEFAAFFCAK